MDNNNSFFCGSDVYFKKAFQRNIGLLTEEEQDKLRNSKVGIVGMGGVGGFHLINMVRLGIGEFHIADMDCYELHNIQRQCGAFVDTLGRNKAETMEKIALSINPYVKIKTFSQGVTHQNIDDFFSGINVLIDGIDFFCIDERRAIFKKAKEAGIYAISAGPLGFGSALLIFAPDKMSFDDYFDINDKMSYLEKIIAFGVGLAPASLHMEYINLDSVDLHEKKGPSLVSACNLCSSLVSTEVLRIILKRSQPKSVPFYLQFDPYLHRFKKGYLLLGNRNPWQRLKRWYLLKKFSKDRK